jgi:hypothetical protein
MLLAAIALFTTGNILVVFFCGGLGALTMLATNTLNFLLCIRETEDHIPPQT